jgi:hypothetical protein
MRTNYVIQIEFRESETSFQPANRPTDWIDTSFSQRKKAIGDLRLPGVSNGRYEPKHPILTRRATRLVFLLMAKA